MGENFQEPGGMGWLPDLPDFRDLTPLHDVVLPKHRRLRQKDSVRAMALEIGVGDPTNLALPAAVDLRAWCSPVEDQKSLQACTAHAGVGLVEYFEKRAFGKYLDASRLFLYKVTRDLLHATGDTGAFLRTTMEAMVLFGVPPEEYWVYDIIKYDVEPAALLYAFAQNYQTIQYFRFDPPGTAKNALLNSIRAYLAAGIPSMFGFTVYSSISQAATTGKIPFPTSGEKILGGHAVDAVGYDDTVKIKNSNPGALETTGAVLIRNSWGPTWGPLGGYLWLPYDFVLKGLAVDWWALLKNEWVDTGNFKIAP